MQHPISEEIHLAQTVNLAHNTKKLKSVDYSTDFNDITDKVTKLQRLLKDGIADKDVVKYLSEMFPLAYQGMICTVKMKQDLLI